MGPPPEAMSSLTVLVSSTANDRLAQFNLSFTGITLTDTAGKTVSVLAASQSPEFMHLNGDSESLPAVS
jgi:hypothetical protein